MNIAILTSPNQWFESYAEQLSEQLGGIPIYKDHFQIQESYDVVFILSYHRLIETALLKKSKHNIVIHESDLPKGKGWSPLFWQVLEGESNIIFTMFEAGLEADDGDIYMQKILHLDGTELNTSLRNKQAELSMSMCLEFINNYKKYVPASAQTGNESFYQKRTQKDSELDINKTIKEQFNLLRVVDNKEYPAFFYLNGEKYNLKIEKS